ncbi:LssY C-terminal domain-containing protein [Actinotignum sanguinis]|uniref:LssY C-terminal domain-containing protein n=1 Tax=Actinotignum sanguinis TaxID=1445614 RepID=A0ABT5V5U8_9ACTO|nr:LssY C-terminal domain-containing protein [Actinotignum sanguinis]MDE1656320.1 LssY C-terminal domain-containing protein [Actinotignum sanguinis]
MTQEQSQAAQSTPVRSVRHSADQRWPVPSRPPAYARLPRQRLRRGFPLYAVLAGLFVVVALIYSFWLAVLLLLRGLPGQPLWWLHLLVFWALAAYFAFPRLHQLFSLMYVPDYFFGRTKTADGILGDPVNIGWEGSEADIHAAMRAAGWIEAEPITFRTSWRIIVAAVLRRSYPSAPVSDLYLFSRKQEFAYQQEVDGNAAQRHHVRFWRCPPDWTLPGGERITWLAAGTFDRSVGLSIFTGQFTHKIDPNIDAERDFIINTVRYADPESHVSVIEQYFNAYSSRNGGGDEIQTDGDLPILDVTGAAARLEERQPDAQGTCGQGGAGAGRAALPGHRRAGDQRLGSRRGGSAGKAGWRNSSVMAEKATELARNAAEHRVPPGALLFSAVAITVLLGTALVTDMMPASAVDVVLYLVMLLLLLGVANHSRVAWVFFLACEAGIALLYLLLATTGATAAMYPAGISVLVVLAITAPHVRLWVTEGRAEPVVDLPTPIL